MSRRLFLPLCNTTCYSVLSRGNIHRAAYEIDTLCALLEPNCELAAVCEQSCTHCVLSPAITLHVPTHWVIRLPPQRPLQDLTGLCVFVKKLPCVPLSDWTLYVALSCLCAYCLRCSKRKWGLKERFILSCVTRPFLVHVYVKVDSSDARGWFSK